MHGHSRSEVRVLALVFALGGLLCLISAQWPLAAHSPVELIRALGAVGLAAAVVVLLAGRRWPAAVVHTGFAVLALLVALAAARSVTAVGVVGLGPMVIAASLYAAQTFSARAARVHTYLLLALSSTGAALSPAGDLVVPWVVVVVTAVAVAEVHGHLVRTLRRAGATDALTGVVNRRAWQVAAERDLAQARRWGRPYSVALIDLDGFKAVNDTRGHAGGDVLLRELTAAWGSVLRRADLLGRLGGDEFALSLPGTTPEQVAVLVARLRSVHPMTWSVGVAHAGEGDDLAVLLGRADEQMYVHKRAGAGGDAGATTQRFGLPQPRCTWDGSREA